MALVGAGQVVTRFYLPALDAQSRLELAAVCSRGGLSAREVAAKHGRARAVSDVTELLRDPALDALLICTPPHAHLALARQALAAGKHVLVEKPVCASHEELGVLIEAAAAAGRVFAATFNNRRREENRWLVEQVRGGAVGALASVRAVWRRSAPAPTSDWARDPRQSGGGGVLADLGSHLLSIALDLAPERRGFSARAECELEPGSPPGIEDRALGEIEIDGGLRIELEAAWGLADLPERAHVRFEARGSAGALTSRDYAGARSDGYGHVLSAFADACRQGASAPAELDLVDDASQVLHALYTSAREGRAVSGRFAAARRADR